MGKMQLRIMAAILIVAGMMIPASVNAVTTTRAADMEPKVIAYYFHTDKRCTTCRRIEEYSQEAIRDGFPDALQNGKLEIRLVNLDRPENRHFIREYKLTSASLVLVEKVNGKETKWTNLRLVWQLTGRKQAFLNYVRKELGQFLS
jgi:hypothetical protein